MTTHETWPGTDSRNRLLRTGPKSSKPRLIAAIAAGLVVVLGIIGAIVASGYDQREAPRTEAGIWVTRTASAGSQYAKVNTETGEIEAVNTVTDPSGIAQFDRFAAMLTRGDSRAWPINSAVPQDLAEGQTAGAAGGEGGGADAGAADAEAGAGSGTDADTNAQTASNTGAQGPAEAVPLPQGTVDVQSAGDWAVLRTERGQVFVAKLDAAEDAASALGGAAPVELDPNADKESDEEGDNAEDSNDPQTSPYRATAATIDREGNAAFYSPQVNQVRSYDAHTGKLGRAITVPEEVSNIESPQLAMVANRWVIFDAATGALWRQGNGSPVELNLEGEARLQVSDPDADSVRVADTAGLWTVTGGEATREVQADGVPTQPERIGDDLLVAWAGVNGASLWRESTGEDLTALPYDSSVQGSPNFELEVRNNGNAAVLNETTTGMLWQLPSGEPIPLSQWEDFNPPKTEQGTVVVEDITDPKPPVAKNDRFGFRPGIPTPLPVMLNDLDPNKNDVLSIDPTSLKGLDASFGSLSLLSDGQTLTFSPAADAEGSASFTYRVTDGNLYSAPATVTLTAQASSTQTAPAWCPVEGCQREWVSATMTPGGTAVLPVLDGWVDPEGDPLTVVSATPTNGSMPLRTIITEDGRLAIRHTNSNQSDADLSASVTIADSRGEQTKRDVAVKIRQSAPVEFAGAATQVMVGTTQSFDAVGRVSGGSGAYRITEVTSGNELTSSVDDTGQRLMLTPREEGSFSATVTVKDEQTDAETTGVVRVMATPNAPSLSIPTLRAYVRPLSDVTVDVLAAIPGNRERAVSVTAASVKPAEGSDLQADIVQHALVRLTGDRVSGPGFLGSVELTLVEGSAEAKGVLNVFQLPEADVDGVITVADRATVRAGSIVDIDVLKNDVAPRGERLMLSPDVTGSGAKGELAFASGSRVRYLAPTKPGNYELRYTATGATAPEASDTATISVTVTPREGNSDPIATPLVARVSPGETTSVSVPLSGVDPDGDRVSISRVGQPEADGVNARMGPAGDSVIVTADDTAKPGATQLEYAVADGFGGTGKAQVRVIITPIDAESYAPVVYSDYVRLTSGSETPQEVLPASNDIDPSGGALKLTEVIPNLPTTAPDARITELKKRLNLKDMENGRITVRAAPEPETVSYKYSVESQQTKSTSDGLIVVQTSERVGIQAPRISDTVLSAGDRARLESDGIDVVNGKVSWASGSLSDLKLSLVGNSAKDYRIEGNRIIGAYKDKGDRVTFALSGTATDGTEVTGYGFLHIYPFDEMQIALHQDFRAIVVDEGDSTSMPVNQILQFDATDRLDWESTRFGVARGEARCELTGSSITYTAGKGAPWRDTCLIRVKIRGQKTYTALAVPVIINPGDPIPVLHPMSRALKPGETQQIQLGEMVSWQGANQGDPNNLRFRLSPDNAAGIRISAQGPVATAVVPAEARPGQQSIVQVSLEGENTPAQPLVLTVGQAAQDRPSGGTLVLNCIVGESCAGSGVGIRGEYDPFADKPGAGLTVQAVNNGTCAPLGSFGVNGNNITMQWASGGVAGMRCSASFTVADAQGRTGQGRIELDAKGIPAPPTALQQTGFTSSSATVRVSLSSAAVYPAVTDVILESGGRQVATCSQSGADWTCTMRGLEVGQKHTVVARAINEAGTSGPSGALTIWAYEAPSAPSLSLRQVDGDGNVAIEVGGSRHASGYLVSVDGGSQRQHGGGPLTLQMSRGSHTVTVTPVGAFDPPISGSDAPNSTSEGITVTGRPTDVTAQLDGSGSFVTATVSGASDTGEIEFGFDDGTGCKAWNPNNYFEIHSMDRRYYQYTVTPCARNQWGQTAGEPATVRLGGTTVPAPQVQQPRFADQWAEDGPSIRYLPLRWTPPEPQAGGEIEILSGSPTNERGQEHAAQLRVRECVNTNIDRLCSDEVAVAVPTPPRVDRAAVLRRCYDRADDFKPDVAVPRRGDVTITLQTSTTARFAWNGLQPLDIQGVEECVEPEPDPEPDPTAP